jgi:hypothetical protein
VSQIRVSAPKSHHWFSQTSTHPMAGLLVRMHQGRCYFDIKHSTNRARPGRAVAGHRPPSGRLGACCTTKVARFLFMCATCVVHDEPPVARIVGAGDGAPTVFIGSAADFDASANAQVKVKVDHKLRRAISFVVHVALAIRSADPGSVAKVQSRELPP